MLESGDKIWSKGALLVLLHLCALWSFAVAQPLFDLLGRHPEFLVARRIDVRELVLLVLSLSLFLPASAAGILLLISAWNRRLGQGARRFLLGGLMVVMLLPPLKRMDVLSGPWTLAVAAAIGVAFLAAYIRFSSVKLVISVSGLCVLVFPVVFLVGLPVDRIMVGNQPPPSATPRGLDDKPPPPVVMVVLDELPLFSLLDAEGNIDARRFPNFARLASQSTWYRYATTVAESTHRALPPMLSGSYPLPGRLPTHLDYPDNLFTLLGRTHELKVFESVTQLCPPDLCQPEFREGLPTRMRALLEDIAVIYGHQVLPQPWSQQLPDIRHGWGYFRQAWEKVF